MTTEPTPALYDNVRPLRGSVDPIDRELPQDFEAEQAVLGAMLLSPESAIPDVTAVLEADDYYRPAHETIHRAICELGEAADPITVADFLDRSGELRRCGGRAYLHTLVQQTPTAANAGYYAPIVRDKADRRRLLQTTSRIAHMASASEGNAENIRAALLAEIAELTERNRSALDQGVPDEKAGGAEPNPLYDPLSDIRRPHRPGPTPHPDVFCGWVGETVRELDPTSEADPVAVLVNILSAAGAIIGRKPHLWVGNDRHPALIWALTIGATAAGRKGSATSTARRVLAAAVPDFFGPTTPPAA